MKTFRDFLTENRDLDMIFEMSKAFSMNNPKGTIWVENPTGYNNKYFKLYNNSSISKATKVARISMLTPKYLEHSDGSGKKNWILTKNQIKNLVSVLDSESEYDGITNWELLILTYNNDNYDINPASLQIGKITKDEYELLVKKHKNAMSIFSDRPKYEESL